MAAATMASINGCHRYDHVKLMNQGIIRALMGSHSSFSSSSSILNSNKFHKQLGRRHDQFGFPPTNRLLRLRVQVQYTQSTDKISSSSSSSTMKGEDKKKANGSDQKVTVYGGKTKAMMIRVPSKVEVRESVEDELKVMAGDEGGFMSSWGGIDGNNIDFWRRSMVVWSFVVSLSARVVLNEYKWAYFGGFTQDKQKSRRRRSAEWLREQILKLGPTFIKIGQLCSTRSDLFPQEFVHELSKLQDRVPAFSAKKARDLIERELGAPIHELFYKFDHHPIAAASLGQVHRAILHNGEKVAVKVQRPGLKKLFDMDLRNLKLVAEYFQRSETFGGPTRDWISIYEECAMILYQEIDYINEGKNADRFRRDFRHVKWVRVPLVFWEYTAREVLTMEYTPGIKINKLDTIVTRGHDRSQISSRAIESYLIQILKTGFFHADPHPGNLAIDVDGALIYYDFGMMGEIKSSTRERLLDLFCAVYERDDKKVIQILKDLEVLGPNGDMSSVRRSVKFLLDNLLNQIDQQKTLATIGEDLFATATDVLCLPSSLTFVMKAFSTLEGIGYMLDPKFSFAKIAAPFAEELFASKQKQHNGKQLVEEIRRQANEARTYAISMPYRIQRIEEFTEQLESGDLRLRVRVLESERAAQKAAILQKATIYTVLGGVLMNMGITFGGQSDQVIANGSFIGASVFFVLFIRSMQKAKKPDKFEKMF